MFYGQILRTKLKIVIRSEENSCIALLKVCTHEG
jgi:hypothetical protein